MSDSGSEEAPLVPDSNSTFTDSLGRSLFCRYWKFDGEPKALVFVCHGYGEHCDRYKKIASAMTKQGLMVFGHDHVGHGLSDGDRVHVEDFMEYVDGVILHVEKMRERFPGKPVFIYGHSMGGQITVKSLLTRPDLFRGAVLIAPLLQFAPELLNPVRIFLGRLVEKICPQAPVIKLNTNHICSDPKIVAEYEADPLCHHGWVKARQASRCLDTVRQTEDRLRDIQHPFLVMHGTDDHLTYCPGSKLLHSVAKSTDKAIKIYEGASHALHDEPGIKHGVIQDATDWILKRC